MRALPLYQPRIVILAAVVAVAGAAVSLGAQLPGQPDKLPDKVPDAVFKRPDPSLPDLVAAAFVRPAPGTRAVYTTGATTVTKADGWRVEAVDDAKRRRSTIGGFIPDSGTPPLILNERAFEDLWPLQVGHRMQVETQRYPNIWRWDITVTTTARVQTDAGKFDCFLVAVTIEPRARGKRAPLKRQMLFWFAPAINAVVRIDERVEGELIVRDSRTDLVRLERPGMPPVGVAAPAAGKGSPRPR